MENKKIIIYTSSSCHYCKQIKDKFEEEKINYKEKSRDKYKEDWYRTVELTGVPMFPTIVINGNYLVAGRDFGNPEMLINMIDYITSPAYKDWDNVLKLVERIKTMNYSINQSLNQINDKLNKIENKK